MCDLRWENRPGVRAGVRVPGLEKTWNLDTNLVCVRVPGLFQMSGFQGVCVGDPGIFQTGLNDSNLF